MFPNIKQIMTVIKTSFINIYLLNQLKCHLNNKMNKKFTSIDITGEETSDKETSGWLVSGFTQKIIGMMA